MCHGSARSSVDTARVDASSATAGRARAVHGHVHGAVAHTATGGASRIPSVLCACPSARPIDPYRVSRSQPFVFAVPRARRCIGADSTDYAALYSLHSSELSSKH